jgi:uncharacterized protein (DUF849 family)
MSEDHSINRDKKEAVQELCARVSRRDFTLTSLAMFAASAGTVFAQSGRLEPPKTPEVVKGKMPPIPVSPEQAQAMFPVDQEPRITTMDKPLLIMSSCPGWQIGGKRYPAVPFTIEDQAQEIADSFNAGAVGHHVHPRDPKTGLAQISAALLKQVLDASFDKVGDFVTMSHTWYPREGGIDYIVDTEELLEWGEGNKYCQGAVVLPFSNNVRANVDKGLRWLEAHDVKPLFEFYDTSAQLHFKQLMDEGAAKPPYAIHVNLGKHDSTAIHQDPGSYLNAIANLDIVKRTFPGAHIGWRTGGRNWLPIMVLGVIMGVDVVQVGIEDAFWRWPHRDEIIKKNSDSVKWAVDIANILGRRVVTDPNEARRIMDMKLTSKFA